MVFWNKRLNSGERFSTIHEAIEANDYAATQKFLRKGVSPNAQDGREATALHIAAAGGYIEIAGLLIKNGANVNFLIDEGGTPLMAASARLKPEMVEYLISKGASPNKKGYNGRFPLICLFHPGVLLIEEQLRCIRLLLKHGAKVDEQMDGGITSLMEAAWFGNREAVDELLKSGAEPALKDGLGRTAATMAFERGHDSLALLLKQRVDQAAED